MFKTLFIKYKELTMYGIFGVLTTLVNVITYWYFSNSLNINANISTIIAFILALIFAFITNKLFVFNSKKHSLQDLKTEIAAFISCRLFSGFVDITLFFVLFNICEMNDLLVKVFTNIVVIILNYILSKTIVFKKSK